MDDLFWLSISGKVNIPTPLEIDTEYDFLGKISIYSEAKNSKQDGSYNRNFKASFLNDVQLLKGEQVIAAKDKEHKSQKLRKAIYAIGHDYNEGMDYILSHLDEIFLGLEMK